MSSPHRDAYGYRSRLDEYQSLYFHTHHLHRLRTTNEPPSEDEADYVRDNVLRAIQEDTDNVDARLEELQSVADAFMQERNKLAQYAYGFKSFLSPIRRLPPELLMEIFQHVCAQHRWQLPFFYHTRMHWVIPQVCKKWRTISLSCPPLWSSIYARLRPGFPATSALDAVLSRSGTHPLKIAFAIGSNEFEDPHIRDSMARLRAHSSRWQTLRTTLEYNAVEHTLDVLRDSYPLLDRLDVDVYRPFSLPFPEFQKTGFHQYPNLRTVVLQDPLVVELDLPWGQLTTLTITDRFRAGGLTTYVQAFRQCPSLQTLEVDIAGDRYPLDDTSAAVPLLALKSLNTAFNVIMNHLVVPQLEEARLGVDYPGDYHEGVLNSTIPSFHKLVLRSKCAMTITSMRLRKVPVSEDLLDLLQLTQNLATLEIRAKMSFSDDEPDTVSVKTIMALISKLQVTDTPFLPKLRHLSINLSKHLERRYFPYLEKQEELVKALQSRWHVPSDSGVEKLRLFRFGIFAQRLDDKDAAPSDSPLELYPETEEALQVLIDEGMKISIRVYSKFARRDMDHVRVNFGSI